MAGISGDGLVFKRRRVAQACQTCRAMKSKCDGKRPECGRCLGYGFTCSYAKGRSWNPSPGTEKRDALNLDVEELRDTIDHYEELVGRLLSDSPQKECHLKEFHEVKERARRALDGFTQDTDAGPSTQLSDPNQHRYLGEVSDVHFFNLVKRFLQTSPGVEQDFDSYEQEGEVSVGKSRPTALPEPDEARRLCEVYFETIHLAYPFIPKSLFMETWGGFQGPLSETHHNSTDLAILYVICAIGSYYNSFPGRDSSTNHEHYFRCAVIHSGKHHSINQVTLLLVQCFYFLAICKTDSCWIALGQAVRIAQSIGLHVESKTSKPRGPVELERRRRIWYSIYVLDRLLSLQLGRPPAIHDEDCSVPMPSRRGDNDIDWTSSIIEPVEGPSTGDYFVAVIEFSRIVGRVLSDIYGPAQERPTAEMMICTQVLDRQLVEWKMNLPRKLRFDLGHAFDPSVAFRRQRNMLAIKYHHLRALIHRPYLCYPLLRQLDDSSVALDWPLLTLFEKTCASEARETARLLHHVSDEKDLVHEFPWWQMISCLICAGSILLVSSIFVQPPIDDHSVFDSEGLRDDAETCLKMFEALSVNSKSARVARDMIKGLKQCGFEWKKHSKQLQPEITQALQSSAIQLPTQMPALEYVGLEGDLALEQTPTPQNWPAEIIDSMAWSSQFFGATQGEGA
ncbi:Zn(2)-C6 fungal-type domain-containing protein [Fusarium keratoplasticum]|uniref:Zn(2)-C6 fungal-type domain-containing protein n=1 Tax=Fusarium keratoplasticum TaxID=1328300 RepID=A0ACC0QMX0_9HYPO|nr:Zn(2)-C6 fungal-type domain-containing protein [Fusarium keratoplasticum]KAI8660148.1 Zn(2)-C6 fungal-type domain-containing protein [Fusarium keratoplasticum]